MKIEAVRQVVQELRSGDFKSHGGWGKWSMSGVPHKDWVCIDIEDMEQELVTCEMCEFAEVRYVHIMKHEEYPTELRVGVVCAERMGEEKARERESEVRRLAANPAKKACVSWVKAANEIIAKGWAQLRGDEQRFILDIRGMMEYSVRPRTKCYKLSERQIGWFKSIYLRTVRNGGER